MSPRSTSNRAEIHKWFEKRIRDSSQRQTSLQQLQSTIAEKTLRVICEDLNLTLEQCLVTVRSSHRKGSQYLRPVYSHPDPLYKILQDPTHQKPFALEAAKAFPNKTPKVLTADGTIFAATIPIPPRVERAPPAESFPERVGDFKTLLTHLWRHNPELSKRAKKVRYCCIAGQNKDHINLREKYELKHLLAIYSPRDPALSNKRLLKLRKHAAALFQDFDFIDLLDAKLFEADGLKMVADLQPHFSRDDLAPADKIGFAINQLESLLSHHMTGRHGAAQPSDVTSNNSPKVFYVAASFDHAGEGRYFPRLELYPHALKVHTNYIRTAFYVTHKTITSSVKFLLYQYFDRCGETIRATITSAPSPASVALSPEFRKLYANFAKEDWAKQITPEEKPDMLHMSESDFKGKPYSNPWETLQKSAEDPVRAIAAFVVEGREKILNRNLETNVRSRCFPRGIFAIESHYDDGFSDRDLDSLRLVFQGLASLIRLISHNNAPLDYRSKIINTLNVHMPSFRRMPAIMGQRLLFNVEKLHAPSLKLLKVQLETDLRERTILHLTETDVDLIIRICDAVLPCDEASRTPAAGDAQARIKLITNRIRDFLFANSDTLDLNEPVLDFFDAVPENFVWASYLAGMAQTLGDRAEGKSEPPDLIRMTPGYSAHRMYMAHVDNELHQVVKLSTAKKLRLEEENYRKYVRYRVVHAARIPVTGFSFDTTGTAGLSTPDGEEPIANEKEEGFGVLISDLVSAHHSRANGGDTSATHFRTLLDLIAAGFSGSSQFDEAPLIKALNNIFDETSRLWATDPKEVAQIPNYRQRIDHLFLTKGREPDFMQTQLDRILQAASSAGRPLKLPEPTLRLIDLGSGTYRIIHGDMNARNLTWAGTLETFFLIDFESVQVGVYGADQARLVVSIVALLHEKWTTEHYAAISTLHTKYNAKEISEIITRRLEALGQELDGTIHYFQRAIGDLQAGNRMEPEVQVDYRPCVSAIPHDTPPTYSQPPLCTVRVIAGILATILSCWPKQSPGPAAPAEEDICAHVWYMLRKSAELQLHYAVRGMEDEGVTDVRHLDYFWKAVCKPTCSEGLRDLVLELCGNSSPKSLPVLSAHIRYFVVVRLCQALYCTNA